MGYLKIITAILIWSSLGIFVRKIGIPTIRIIFYPATVAGILQLILLLMSGQIKRPMSIKGGYRYVVYLLSVPIFFITNMFLFFFAFRHTTIANAVFTHYTAPIFVALLTPLLLREKIHRRAWIAIILSSLGLWLMLGTLTSDWKNIFNNKETAGIIAGLLSGVAYAFLILIIRKIVQDFSPLFIIFVQNSIVSILLLPFIINTPHPLNIMPYMLIMGVVHSTLAPLLYVDGLKSVKANEAAILGYLEPVGAVLLALIILHEIPGIRALSGGALILYSGLLIVKRAKG
jgi:drug/metabolite transporter (DMT)-like permease